MVGPSFHHETEILHPHAEHVTQSQKLKLLFKEALEKGKRPILVVAKIAVERPFCGVKIMNPIKCKLQLELIYTLVQTKYTGVVLSSAHRYKVPPPTELSGI